MFEPLVLIGVAMAGGMLGAIMGFWLAMAAWNEREKQRRVQEIAKKKLQMERGGRRIPRQPGAGEPIVVRKIRLRRNR